MFKKSFVSLAFSSQKIEVVALDSTQKKIKIIGSASLPAGTIVNREIKNPIALTQIINSSWKNLKISEKSVGLVVPEFSTYTKSITLPNLSIPELDEAVRWQSKDFLPGQAEDMILDWKIIKKTGGNYQILVVAIQKDVLTSYVDVVEKAGLYPLVVETPSLSLSRIANSGDRGCMIIYVKPDETVIVISQNNSIVASSLASSTSQNEIISTAARMLRHYTQIPVYSIFVGGLGLNQDFLKNISDYLKLPVQLLSIQVSGISPDQIQDYLIPISLQFKDPAEPQDEKTVNLLPPAWAQKYKNRKTTKKYWSLSLSVSFATWATFLVLLSVFIVFNQKVSVLKSKAFSDLTSEQNKSEITINEVNSLSKRVLNASDTKVTPESLINQIASQKPSDIRVQKYDLNMEDGEIAIEGTASSRQTLLVFKESLSKIPEVQNIDLPITNLINEGPIVFNMKIATKTAQKVTVPKLNI